VPRSRRTTTTPLRRAPSTVPYTVFFNGALGPLQVEFATNTSGGATEYRFTQSFINDTGQVGTGCVFELGYGLGAAFTPWGATDGLDFDGRHPDPTATASLFSMLSHQTDRIEWSGGSVPSVGELTPHVRDRWAGWSRRLLSESGESLHASPDTNRRHAVRP